MFVDLRKLLLMSLTGVLLTSCAVVVNPRKEDTNQAGVTKSISSDTKSQITFINKSGQEVKIYWLDFSGRRVLYTILEANKSYSQQTYLTHPWLVTDGRDNTLNIFFADAQPRVVEITTPTVSVTFR
jgi:hypothetical protein